MNTSIKFLLAGIAVATAIAVQTPVYAESDVNNIVSDLREQHAALKAQVDAGEITKEEALETWQSLIDAAREEKEIAYQERLATIEEKIEELSEENPERAATLETRLSEINSRHTQREQIRTQLKNGEISKEEAKNMLGEIRSEIQANKETFMEARQERKENRPDGMGKMKGQTE